jgi:glycosyltransferase involved in cell wall biosynthesis
VLFSAPSLTIVIPAFNASHFLERAVSSVFATGYPGISIVIIDDGSTDATRLIGERLCVEWEGRCRLLWHPGGGNHGVSSSRNLGISISNSEWIALLDADDFYLPNRFEAFLREYADGKSFDAIYGMAEIQIDALGRAPTPTVTERFGIAESLSGELLLTALLKGNSWHTDAFTVRRELLQRTGLFDPDKCIAEDCDLWFRIAALGRIVAGDLENPGSVYWRHANNTYHYKPEHRIAMVKAMLDAWAWTKRNGASPSMVCVFRESVPAYVTRSIISAREAGQPQVAWELLRLMARHGKFGFLVRPTTVRQVLSMARNCFRHSTNDDPGMEPRQ